MVMKMEKSFFAILNWAIPFARLRAHVTTAQLNKIMGQSSTALLNVLRLFIRLDRGVIFIINNKK